MNRSLLVTALAFCACGYTKTMNPNTGDTKALSFGGAETAVPLGQTIAVSVVHLDSGDYHCTQSTGISICFDCGATGGDACMFAGTSHPIARITGALCDNGACTVTVKSSGEVDVTGSTAGTTHLDVTAVLDDGTTVADSTAITFVAVDRIDVASDEYFRCVGPNAIFPGTVLSLSPAPFAGETQVARTVDVQVEPDGIIEVTAVQAGEWSGAYFGQPTVTVKALSPGIATVHFVAGAFETVRTFRVAALAEVVEGHLYAFGTELDDDVSWNPVGARATSDLSDTNELIVGWTLSDGTLAIGGAEKVSADFPDFAALAAPDTLNVQPASGALFTSFYMYPSHVPSGTTVTLSGSLGSGVLKQTFVVP